MADPIDEAIGHSIRGRRCALNLTQRALGERAGIKARQLHRFEVAANRVSATQLWWIARALNVEVADLFEGVPRRSD